MLDTCILLVPCVISKASESASLYLVLPYPFFKVVTVLLAFAVLFSCSVSYGLSSQGHKNLVHSVCWDLSGEYVASVSDDLVRVWNVGSGSKGEFVHELSCTGNKFHTCVFHPTYPILVIGCYEASLNSLSFLLVSLPNAFHH